MTVTQAYGTADASSETSTYSGTGRLLSAGDGKGNTTTYTYDGMDRLSSTSFPGGGSEQLGYDPANGNLVTKTLRDGQVLRYTYDALRQRTYDDNPNTNVAEVDVGYSYDNLGRVLSAGDQNGWTKYFEYDALGRKTRERSNVGDNALQYDAAGRLTRQTWNDGFFVTYDYDAANELTVIHENGGLVLASFAYERAEPVHERGRDQLRL